MKKLLITLGNMKVASLETTEKNNMNFSKTNYKPNVKTTKVN